MPDRWQSALTGLVAVALCAGLAGAGRAEDKPVTEVDASKGGLTVRSGDNSLTFLAYLQVRGLLEDREDYDADAKGTLGYGLDDGLTPSFDVAKVRPTFRGTMFKPWAKYMVMFELSRTSGESSSKVKDAYLELGREGRGVQARGGHR
jgi:hypothetical protein